MIINFGKGNGGGGSTGGGIPEAPKDGKLYGRKDATWSEVPEGAIGIWIPKYSIQPNAETGRDELIIGTPLTDEQKTENLKNLPLLEDENAVGYFKRNEFRDNGDGLTQTRYFTYPIINKYILKSSDGYETWNFKYLYESLKEDTVRMDISTGDVQRIYRYTYQEKLVSGKNIKTINGQDILGRGNLEFSGGGGNDEEYKLFIPVFEENENGELIINSDFPLTQEQIDSNNTVLQKIKDDGANLTKDEQALLMEKVVLIQPMGGLFTNMLTPTFMRYPNRFEAISNSWRIYLNFRPDGNISWNKFNGIKLKNDVNEAPKDGKLYARQNSDWTEIISGGGGSGSAPKILNVPKYIINENEQGEIKKPLTAEQKQENLNNLPSILKNEANGFVKIFMGWGNSFLLFNILKLDSGKNIYFMSPDSKDFVFAHFDETTGDVDTIARSNSYQFELKSGTNIKTINGKSLLDMSDGTDLVISGGGSASAPTIGENGNWYIDGVDTGKPSRGPQGDMGEQGPQGEMGNQGESGKDGTVVTAGEDGFWYLDGIKSDKPWKGKKGDKGESGKDGTVVTAGEDGFWYLDGIKSDKPWKGKKGDKGESGKDGMDGMDGKSAYQVAVENGFLGNEQEWLDSLKGEKGDMGETPELKTINGESIVGNGDITVATTAYVDEIVGTANNRLNLI